MKGRLRNYLKNFLFPAVVLGALTGILTAVVVCAFKLCAKYAIAYSQTAYAFLRANPVYLPAVVVGLALIAFGISWIYQKAPYVKGGGIPTAIGILRGLITFRWLWNLLGTFLFSVFTFFLGVPLGNEGPSVLMGTAIGRGTVSFCKKHRAWDRYTMTGGASAGFAVATGAPFSGVMFAIEEAHERVSPMIIIVSMVTVLCAMITTHLISPLLDVPVLLFPHLSIPALAVKNAWIPLVVGLAVGLFSVGFLKLFRVLRRAFEYVQRKVPHAVVLLIIFVITLCCGILSYSLISTGHALTESLLEGNVIFYMLFILLIVRTLLTLGANTAGVTGGIFLPLIAVGALFSSLCAEGLVALGVSRSLYTSIVVFGITACLAGMMNMPLTAVVFSIEALGAGQNMIYTALAAVTAFILVEAFRVRSINDKVLDGHVKERNQGKRKVVIDTCMTVQENSFAEGKRVKDVFWPADCIVLSVTKSPSRPQNAHGLAVGDVLHLRYTTTDEVETDQRLQDILGKPQSE